MWRYGRTDEGSDGWIDRQMEGKSGGMAGGMDKKMEGWGGGMDGG